MVYKKFYFNIQYLYAIFYCMCSVFCFYSFPVYNVTDMDRNIRGAVAELDYKDHKG